MNPASKRILLIGLERWGITFADSIHFIDLSNFLLGMPLRRVHAVTRDFFQRAMDDESLIDPRVFR